MYGKTKLSLIQFTFDQLKFIFFFRVFVSIGLAISFDGFGILLMKVEAYPYNNMETFYNWLIAYWALINET